MIRNTIEAQDLIKNLLKLEPTERLSIPEILSHPWLASEDDNEDDNEEYNYYIVKNENAPENATEIAPTINELNVENLFFQAQSKARLNFKDYCYIANDFYTHHIGILGNITG